MSGDVQPAALSTAVEETSALDEMTQGPAMADSPADDAISTAAPPESDAPDLQAGDSSNSADPSAEAPEVEPAEVAFDVAAEEESVQPGNQQVQLPSISEAVEASEESASAAIDASSTAALIAVSCLCCETCCCSHVLLVSMNMLDTQLHKYCLHQTSLALPHAMTACLVDC